MGYFNYECPNCEATLEGESIKKEKNEINQK